MVSSLPHTLHTTRALVRAVPRTYPSCIREHATPISLDVAITQHAAYVAALAAAGVTVEELPPLDDAPDAIFVEDTAVILGAHAIVTRPGAEARRAEVASVARVLAGLVETLDVMEAPATLDGGDVLRAGRFVFAGLSRRSNEAGLTALGRVVARAGLELVAVPVARGLHLKSACTLAGPETLVYWPGDVDVAPMRARGLECVAVPEHLGANVLALGAHVLVSASAPRTLELLVARGLDCTPVDVSELHKGDGALTCSSLRLAAPGAWAT
ncbi:arginine deiminase-related protein [Myxococcota bacterium]|nr:arginine deiminase-related protein [Myxococcota bacterium]